MTQTLSIETVRIAIRELDRNRGTTSIDPGEIARHIVGSDPASWGRVMKPLRTILVRMAEAGEIELLRKGKPIAPADVRGVYRLRVLDLAAND